MKNKACWVKSIFLFLVLLTAVNPAQAGWVMDYVSGDETYISSGKSKEISKEDGTLSIVDGKAGKHSTINIAKKIYWQGTAKELCTALKQMIPQMEGSLAKPKVSVKQAGSEKIAGHTTQKYQVMANDRLHKEIWVTENKELAEEVKALEQYGKELIECRPAQTMEEMVERDPAYHQVVTKGYVMKEINYVSGTPVYSDEVVSFRKKDIPASEFDVPAGYRRVQSLMEIWM